MDRNDTKEGKKERKGNKANPKAINWFKVLPFSNKLFLWFVFCLLSLGCLLINQSCCCSGNESCLNFLIASALIHFFFFFSFAK